MNLTDLSAELQARADDPAPSVGPAVSRLSGVRHRIQLRRRRQAATAAGIAAVTVAAVVLAPTLSGVRADRTPPPATTATKDPLVFASDVAGDPLVATALGAPGQRELVVRFTPTVANLAISTYCRVDDAGKPNQDEYSEATMTVNGEMLTQGGCSPDDGPNQQSASRGDEPEAALAAWKLSGLRIGQESVFRLRVTSKRADFDPAGTVRLGIGIYVLSAPRVVSDGVRIPQLMDMNGQRYKLAGYRTAAISASKRQLEVVVPASRYPVQLQWGVTDLADGDGRGNASLMLDQGESLGTSDVGIVSGDVLPDAATHTLRIKVSKAARGVMQIAYYTRSD